MFLPFLDLAPILSFDGHVICVPVSFMTRMKNCSASSSSPYSPATKQTKHQYKCLLNIKIHTKSHENPERAHSVG